MYLEIRNCPPVGGLEIINMPLTAAAIKTILDIKDDVVLSEAEMAKELKVTFFPRIMTSALGKSFGDDKMWMDN